MYRVRPTVGHGAVHKEEGRRTVWEICPDLKVVSGEVRQAGTQGSGRSRLKDWPHRDAKGGHNIMTPTFLLTQKICHSRFLNKDAVIRLASDFLRSLWLCRMDCKGS